jgi:hypothetical protein
MKMSLFIIMPILIVIIAPRILFESSGSRGYNNSNVTRLDITMGSHK